MLGLGRLELEQQLAGAPVGSWVLVAQGMAVVVVVVGMVGVEVEVVVEVVVVGAGMVEVEVEVVVVGRAAVMAPGS